MPPTRRTIVLALLAVYVIWGSTYWAIAVMVRTLPALFASGLRFLAAGALLAAFLRARGAPWPTRPQWRGAAIVGALLLPGGNGLVAWSQQWVSSSLAAIVVSTMPLWAALVASLWGESSSRREWTALAIGFVGVVWMNASGELMAHGPGALLLLLAPVLWAIGSIAARRVELPVGAMATAAEMLTGGAVLTAIGLGAGERIDVAPSLASVGAWLYLVLIGSMVALSAYGLLLRHARPAVATSYAYVNPIIAVALGVGLAGDRPSLHTLLGGAIVLGSVVAISWGRSRSRPGAVAYRSPASSFR